MEQQLPSRQGQYIADDASWYRPLIGIPCCVGRRAGATYPLAGTYRPFTQLVELAGGTPVLLPPVADPAAGAAFWQVLDGLLLPGGVDVHPAAYGEEPHPLLGTVDVDEDALEIGLVREGLSWDIPCLGINRGMQLLNVAVGGTLFQDLIGQLGGGIWHHVTTRQARTYLAHPISVIGQTRLAACIGTGPLLVNSFHHQGIRRLGEGVCISALAPDDVIEAIELSEQRFVLGVQWALEALALTGDQRMLALFQAYIEAARAYGLERHQRQLQGRRLLERVEGMWVRDVAAYAQCRQALFADGALGLLEESQQRQHLPILKGQVRAMAEALGRPDPTPPGTRL